MSGRSNLTVPSGPGLMSGSMGDPSNQPMDLVQKNTVNRNAEHAGIVKAGGGTTLVHYTASGVAQILTTSGTTHVVTTKPVSRGEGGNVGIGSGQTVTLVSRTGPNAALNLAAGGNNGPPQQGGISSNTLRTIPPSHNNQSTTITPYGHHIPRGAAQVANISAPRSQSVATPILRTPGQSPGTTAGRGGLVNQRVVSTPGGWGRGNPSPAHSQKMMGQQQGMTPVARGTTMGGPRATQPPPSITTYHAGVRGSSGSIRAATTTMRGMVDGSNPRGPQPKSLHIAQTQKYGLVGGGNRVVTTIGSGSGGTPTGVYSSGPQLVTPTLATGTTITSSGPGPMRAPAPPTIAVRITTAPVPTPTSTSQVTSQAGGGTISGMMTTTSSGATMISHHPTNTMPQHRNMDPHTTFKTSPIVRAPVTHQSNNKTNMAAFNAGPKVITESAQPPSLTLSQLSGLTGVTAQKTAVNAHPGSHSHGNVMPRTGSSVVASSVGRLNIPSGGAIPVAKVLPQQQQQQGMDRSDRISSSVSISGPVPPGSVVSLSGPGGQQHSLVSVTANSNQEQQQSHHPPPPHTSVFLHRAHAGVSVTSGISVTGAEQRVVTTVPQYTGITTTPYFFDQNASGGPTLVPHSNSNNQYSAVQRGASGLSVSVSNAVTVTAVPPGGGPIDGAPHTGNNGGGSGAAGGPGASNMKPTASPRPSILRKRADKFENDGPLKAARNLSAALVAMPSPPSPKRPDSRGNGNASSGSTTISANSSPGLQIEEMDSHGVGHIQQGMNSNVVGMGVGGIPGRRSPPSIKQEPPDEATTMQLPVSAAGYPHPPHLQHHMSTGLHRSPSDGCSTFPVTSATTTLTVPMPQLSAAAAAAALADGLSPRKKPRKQQLMGNELQEARSSEDDLDHPPHKKNKRDMDLNNQDGCMSDEDLADGWDEEHGHSRSHSRSGGGHANTNDRHNSSSAERPANGIVLLTNRPQMSLINSVRQNWKPRHNHFARHSDVRPKDEKKPTVNEIANQKLALQRVNGWKVVHLGGQVEDLVELESEVVDQLHMLLSSLEKRTHHRKPYKEFDKDVNRLSELVKANVQRSKIIKDQMTEARTQMHKLFDHKTKIVDIMTKYGSKRSLRKKEKT